MRFAWPWVLWALALVPALIVGYAWQERRRRRRAVPYSSVALLRAARPSGLSRRRHLPFALVMGALVLLTLAGARPQARMDVPVSSSAVIIALDVSGSMCATDVDPNRLSAAQDAVRDFVAAQDGQTRIGLVVFSGSAQVAVAPTTEREDLTASLDSLTTGRGTTIGAAILKSVEAISRINPDVYPPDPDALTAARAPGDHVPEIVVLLTDGANTSGMSAQAAAELAAQQGVRIYPIGFGTTNPTTLVCTAQQMGGTRFDRWKPGRGGSMARRSFLVADEDALREVADVTGGRYFGAQDASALQEVLADLPRQVEVQKRDVELGAGLVALAVLAVLGALAAAVRWTAFP